MLNGVTQCQNLQKVELRGTDWDLTSAACLIENCKHLKHLLLDYDADDISLIQWTKNDKVSVAGGLIYFDGWDYLLRVVGNITSFSVSKCWDGAVRDFVAAVLEAVPTLTTVHILRCFVVRVPTFVYLQKYRLLACRSSRHAGSRW